MREVNIGVRGYLFVIAAVLAGCTEAPSIATTSLEGSIPCGTTTCGSQFLCETQASGIDAGTTGAPGGPSCQPAPSNCPVFDCHGLACARCILDMCAYSPILDDQTSVTGRDLFCPAE
jgi:hypothetical protein